MGGAKIRFHIAALALGPGEKMHVDLVRSERCAVMADLRKIERGCVVLGPANTQNRAATAGI